MSSRLSSDLLCASAILIALCAAGCGRRHLEGTWNGSTSQGRDITITLKDNAVTELKLGWRLQMESPCRDNMNPSSPAMIDYRGGATQTIFQKPHPLTSGALSLDLMSGSGITGKLTGDFEAESASGKILLIADPSSGCRGQAEITWKATRQK